MAEKGCEVAIASIADADGLTKAFSGVEGVFLMTPPDFDPEPGFPKTHEAMVAIKTAIDAARPGKVVFLSTVGAHVSGEGRSRSLFPAAARPSHSDGRCDSGSFPRTDPNRPRHARAGTRDTLTRLLAAPV